MYEKVGPITILPGKTNSRVPYSTSLLIEGNQEAALIDCGGGQEVFKYIQSNYKVTSLYLTHYHLDHVWGAYLFKEAQIAINPFDVKKLSDPYELAKVNGVSILHSEEEVEKWVNTYFNEGHAFRPGLPTFQPVMGLVNSVYPYHEPLQVADTTMVMLHTPGHTEGFCCPYFPEHGLLFVGDYDLTSFGPWYNNADSDIEKFAASAQVTLETDAEYFVTAHQKGSFHRKDYEERLKAYIDIIYQREEKTRRAIEAGVEPKDIVLQEIFYFLSNHRDNSHLMESEIIGIAKHIQELIKKGFNYGDYYKAFVSHFKINTEALDYRSEPVL